LYHTLPRIRYPRPPEEMESWVSQKLEAIKSERECTRLVMEQQSPWVKLTGLQKATGLNGRVGIRDACHSQSGRWHVCNSSRRALKKVV
jgi:hypothetical protein